MGKAPYELSLWFISVFRVHYVCNFDGVCMTDIILFVLGVIYIAAGVRAVFDPDFIGDIMVDFRNSVGLTYLTGTFVVVICLALLVIRSDSGHNEWGSAKQGVASFILWAGLFKGLAFIAFPRVLFGLWDTLFPQGKVARVLGIVIIALGAALVWWART